MRNRSLSAVLGLTLIAATAASGASEPQPGGVPLASQPAPRPDRRAETAKGRGQPWSAERTRSAPTTFPFRSYSTRASSSASASPATSLASRRTIAASSRIWPRNVSKSAALARARASSESVIASAVRPSLAATRASARLQFTSVPKTTGDVLARAESASSRARTLADVNSANGTSLAPRRAPLERR
jgi:hypothetical protein